MKNLVVLLFIFLSFSMQAEQKPWKVTGEFTCTVNRPIGCKLACTLSLLNETFDIATLDQEYYEEDMSEDIKKWILHANGKFLELIYSGRPLNAFIKDIQIKPNRSVDESLPAGKFRMQDVEVDIIFLFSASEEIDKLEVNWLLFPDALTNKSKVEGAIITAKDYEVEIIVHGDSTVAPQ